MAVGDDELRRALADNVARIRKNLGLSQEALAHEIGGDRAFISLIERGKSNITIDNLGRIAAALGVEAFELLRPRSRI